MAKWRYGEMEKNDMWQGSKVIFFWKIEMIEKH